MEARRFPEPEVVGSIPTAGAFVPTAFRDVDRMAEWSKAPDPSSGLFGGAGSNPAPVTRLVLERHHGKMSNALLPGFEPGLPDSRSGVLTTTLQERSPCAAKSTPTRIRTEDLRRVEATS